MATSGSYTTSQVAAPSRKWYFELSWKVTKWSGNTATISWEIYCRANSGTSGSTWVSNYGFSGSIAGHSFSSSSNFTKDDKIKSGSFTISGGSSISANITAHPYSSSYTSSGSKSWTLSNNVVAPTVTVTIDSKTETTITASMSVTNNGNATIKDNYIDIFTDSACTDKVGVITGTSGTFTGLIANKTYYARANASNGTYRGYSSVKSTSTYQYPYVSGIETENLIIGNQQTLTIYNPLGRSVDVWMYKDSISGTPILGAANATSGTSYSFTPNASLLYNSIPESSSANCVYYCTYSNNIVQTKSGTYSVSGDNAQAPTFTNFNYRDIDSLASQLTGKNGVDNPGVLISDLSDCSFIIPSSMKATSNYGATLDHYSFSWPNGTNASGAYSSSESVNNHVYGGNTTKISASAYDKRGQYKTVEKTITLITPKHATGITNTARRNGVEATTYLNGSISYWAGDWNNGNTRPNNLYKIEYRVNETGSYHDITSAVVNNSTSNTNNNIRTLSLSPNTIQLHQNGSSGGFATGLMFTIEIFVTTGVTNNGTQYNYDNRQKIATITVNSGVFGMSRYKDSNGQYHYSINGLPDGDYTLKVNGKMHVAQLVDNTDGNWITARDRAIVNNTKGDGLGGYAAVVGQKTKDGHWTMGHVNSNDSNNYLDFVYTEDADYNSETNRNSGRLSLKPHDAIIATFPIGAVYISNTNLNPGSKFGGTWSLIDKQFKSMMESQIESTVWTATKTSACTVYVSRSGHTLFIEINPTPSVALSDTTVTLGTIDFSKIGITRLPHSLWVPGFFDGGNGIAMCRMAYDTGEVEVVDVVTKTSGGTIASGNSGALRFVTNIQSSMMIDSFCDKFYWERTA